LGESLSWGTICRASKIEVGRTLGSGEGWAARALCDVGAEQLREIALDAEDDVERNAR
jgi:hypothetical protein